MNDKERQEARELLKQAFIEADVEYFDKILAEAPESGLPPIEYDVTGTPLCPGHPKICLGSGDFPGFECCCDECDHFLKCFPEWDAGGSAWENVDQPTLGH